MLFALGNKERFDETLYRTIHPGFNPPLPKSHYPEKGGAAKAKKQRQGFINGARNFGDGKDEGDFDRAPGKISKALPTETVKDRKPKKRPM